MNDLPTALRAHRSKLFFTQEEYAAHLKVSRAAIAAWELGIRQPSLAMCKLLVDDGIDAAVALGDRAGADTGRAA